jgi:peptidoglycan hydrolase-like protein with peptidoglycan-binding domain
MAGLAEFLLGMRGTPEQPQDEVLDIVKRARREEELRQAGVASPSERPGVMADFLQRGLPTAMLGLGPPMPTTEKMPIPERFIRTAGGENDNVKALQRMLKEKGYYKGPIDGNMGGGTAAAKEAFDKAEATKGAQDLERSKASADAARAEADALRAKTEAAKIAADEAAAQRKVQDRETGDAKLKKAEENLPWYSTIMRDYAQPLGIAGGTLAALRTRGKIINRYNTGREDLVRSADDLMKGAPPSGTPVNASNLGDRAGRVNEFWSKGQGRSPEQPFLSDPTAARGFKSNPDAPQSGGLYQPNLVMNRAMDAAVPLAGGVEYGLANYLKGGAQQRLDAAAKAYGDDPSDVNLQALQKAKENVAMYEGGERLGQTMASVGLAKSLFGGRVDKRPGTAIADAERAAIDAYLKKNAPGGGPQPPPRLASIVNPAIEAAEAPLAMPAPAPKPKPVGGSHPDHNWNAKAGKWQDTDGKFLSGPPPKD